MSHPLAIEHEAVYPHSPERVWRALVDPTELAAWLMPTDFAPEVGKEFKLETGAAEIGTIQGEVLEIDEPRVLRCRWSGVFGDTQVTYELTPEGDGTRLRVRHDGWDDPPAAERAGFDDGWKQKLDEDIPRVLGPVN
ncbi:MAG TPA: SRPBCC domain-containing protein [Acidimicrobiia bacterium]